MLVDEGDEVGRSEYGVVVDDPSGQYWEGALVKGREGHILRSRGVIVLPVDPRMFRFSGIGGYMKRSWGAGFPLTNVVPALNCPLTLFVAQQLHGLYWAARLAPTVEAIASGMPLQGSLRLAADSGQKLANAGGLTAVENKPIVIEALGAPDAEGGWTVQGSARINSPSDGFVGLALYGQAQGIRVVWAAVSQSA